MFYTYKSYKRDADFFNDLYNRDCDIFLPECYRIEPANDLPYHPKRRELEIKFEKTWADYKRGYVDSSVMWQAQDELRVFLSHSPEERIALLQSEIDQLEPQLKAAKKTGSRLYSRTTPRP